MILWHYDHLSDLTNLGKTTQPARQQTTTRPSTAASIQSTITVRQQQTTSSSALSTAISMSFNSSKPDSEEKRLVFTARYLLSIDCRDAMMEPQPAVLLSAARYKYKDLQLICGKSVK